MECMKYFVICIIAVILLEQFAEIIYRRTGFYKRSQGGAERFRNSVPSELDIVNIGSGPGLYAISYNECRWKGFNFSTAPQNYKYGFRILKRFQKHIKKGAIIIIIMCPLSFGRNRDYDSRSYSDKFYGILPKEDIDNYSFARSLLLKMPLLMKLIDKAGQVLSKRETIFEEPICELPIIATWKSEFELTDLKDSSQAARHQEAFNEKIQILENGITFCKAHEWKPLFVIPPVPPGTREYISDEFLDSFIYQNLEVIWSEHPDIPLLDYYSDNRFKSDMFKNDVFMNPKGRMTFSGILFKDIEEKKYVTQIKKKV